MVGSQRQSVCARECTDRSIPAGSIPICGRRVRKRKLLIQKGADVVSRTGIEPAEGGQRH